MKSKSTKLPPDIDADQAAAVCQWHERCKADPHIRYALSLENAINLKLSCGPRAAAAVARWWQEQKSPMPKTKRKPIYTELQIIEAVRKAAGMSPGGGPGEDSGEYADGAVSVLGCLGIDTPKDLQGPDADEAAEADSDAAQAQRDRDAVEQEEREQRRRDHWEGP